MAHQQTTGNSSHIASEAVAPLLSTHKDPYETLEWLDSDARLLHWLAGWLRCNWVQIYYRSLTKLPSRDRTSAQDRMETGLSRLAEQLPKLTSARHLEAVHDLARKYGLDVTHEEF